MLVSFRQTLFFLSLPQCCFPLLCLSVYLSFPSICLLCSVSFLKGCVIRQVLVGVCNLGQGGAPSVCGLIVGQHGASAVRADSNVKVFNNAEVLTGLFIRVKLK